MFSFDAQPINLHILRQITQDFSENVRIGSGGYGAVYKGVLGGDEIAVKKLFPVPGLDDVVFDNEFCNLKKVQHKNVIRLIGYCYEIANGDAGYEGKFVWFQVVDRALCFEYMKGGSLAKHISDESCKLDWPITYKIIKGTCEGLHYLHKGRGDNNYIYHLDLKPDNILLDENFVPKIGDFGLSRLFGHSWTHKTSMARGTCGFMPPEYIDHNKVTPKNDVFSLGVIIFYMLAGKQRYDDYKDMLLRQNYSAKICQEFTEDVLKYWEKKMEETVGYRWDQTDVLGVTICIEIAMRCVHNDRDHRPSTSVIIEELKKLEDQIEKNLEKDPKPHMGVVPFEELTDMGDLSSSSASIVESTKVMEGLADEDIIDHTLNKKGGKVVDAVSKETIKLIKSVQAPTVSYLTGSIDSLVKKLAELKTHTKFEALHEDLVSLKKDFFDKLASNGRLVVNLQVKVWIKQLRELVFDIEDWIDGNKDTIKWDPKEMKEKTKEFNTLIKEARRRCIRYDLLVKAGTDVAGLSLAPSKVIAVDSPVLWGDKAFDVVGLGGLKQMLKEHLLHEHKMLKVVSIIGTGGIGKTTLAKELHGELQAEFSCGAFIHIGRSPSVRTILVNILHQTMSYSDRKVYFKAPPKRDDVDFLPLWEREHEVVLEKQLDKQQVVALLWRHLSKKRYFIVLDDIWSIRYWRAISGALPDNSLGSRILTTTRIMDVAESCSPGRNNVVHHIKPLSQVESKRLFYEKEGRPADDEILKMCCGIPFAIILAAGTRKYEEHVGLKMPGKSIFSLNQYPTLDGMTNILHIIYADLSLPVRSCLLYLAVFPENYTIKKNRLIQLWGAEGFIPEETISNDGIRDTEQLWKTGESYFNELISRRLIQPVFNYDDYEAVGCTVHPVVLDFIRSLSREENFATMASELESGSSSVDTIRRFSLDSSNEDVAGVLASSRVYVSSMRSLTVFKDVEGMFTVPSYSPTDILPSTSENLPLPSVHVNLVPAFKLTRVLDLLAGFKLMRILDLEDTQNLENRHLIGIGGLVLLRFLGIGGTGIDQLPEEIGKLMQLETLDLRLNLLPASMVNLENLMHLHIDMYFVGQEMSEELQELDKVTNLLKYWNRLRMLGLTLDARYLTSTIPRSVASFFEEVFRSNLESLSLHFPFGPDELISLLVDSWKNVTSSPAAKVTHARFEPRRFELIISEVDITGVPLKMASLLHLTHLRIKLFSVDDEVLGILGGLPKLFLLNLSSAYRPPHLGGCIITEDVFPCLKAASFKGQMGLVFQERAMPQLQMLSFHTSKGHFYDGIDRLTCLTRVHAIISYYGATDSETKTWEARIREQVSLNPNKLALKFIRAYEETMS